MKVHRQNRHIRLPRDMPKSTFPLLHLFPRTFRRDSQPEPITPIELFLHLPDHAVRSVPIDRNSAEPSQNRTERPKESLALADELHVQPQSVLEQQSPNHIPIARMRRRNRNQFRHVRKLARHAPIATRENPSANRCDHARRAHTWHLRRNGRKARIAQSMLHRADRDCLCFARFFFEAMRRSFDARVGFVATRFFGTCSAARMMSARRSRASSRLRA